VSLGFAESWAGAASTIATSPSTISESRGWRVSAENSRRKFGGVVGAIPSSERNSVGGSGVCPTTVVAASSRTATPRKGRGTRTINYLLLDDLGTARTAHAGGDACAGDRAASYSLFLFGWPQYPFQPGFLAETTDSWLDRAIVRVVGITRLIVVMFRRRLLRFIRDIGTVALLA
jgi:hypothetical protein